MAKSKAVLRAILINRLTDDVGTGVRRINIVKQPVLASMTHSDVADDRALLVSAAISVLVSEALNRGEDPETFDSAEIVRRVNEVLSAWEE
jgi:hypothetical protein